MSDVKEASRADAAPGDEQQWGASHVCVYVCARVQVVCVRVCVVLMESSEHRSSKRGPPSRARVHREGAGDTYPTQPLLPLLLLAAAPPHSPHWLKELTQEHRGGWLIPSVEMSHVRAEQRSHVWNGQSKSTYRIECCREAVRHWIERAQSAA